jgi:hypothetical protein
MMNHEADDAWGFGTSMEKVEESSTDVVEEAWFAEEPTVVWNDVREVVEIKNDIEGGNVLAPVHDEKNVQVLEPVL